MAEVVVHIYDVTNSGSEINRFYKDGIGPIGGVFHCAIQVYGDDEWSYGCCEQGTGVFSCAITKNPMHAYREKIVLGKTDCTIFMVDQILRELSREWSGDAYDFLSKNCNHFCDVLCGRLGVPKLPGWVHRFANDGDTALEVAEDTKLRVKEAKAELVSTSKVASSFSNVSSNMTNSSTSTGQPQRPGTLNNSDNGNMKMQGTWKMVAKRSRSSTKRAKKQVARSRDIEAEYKSATSASAEGDSGSEKLGVSVPGQNFSERVEHVPLKKRRFMVPSPSPLNRSLARAQINHSLPVSRLNPNLMRGKTSKIFDDKPDCGSHDFFGIKILAEVACSSGMSSEIASALDGQIVEHVREQDALTFSPNDSSTGTVDVSGKDTTIESSDKVEEGKSKILAPQNTSVDILGHASAADQSEGHNMVASSSMIVTRNISIAVSNESSTDGPRENLEAGDSRHLATQSELATVSENLSGDERTGKSKNSECITDDRLHWDLNLPTDAWGQPGDVVDEISGRYSDGEVTESITESRHVDGSKDYPTGLIASDIRMNSQLLSGPSAGESVRNGKECQSGYDSQFEDGELREPYPWEENEGDSEDVEQVDYGSEPEKERLYSLAESNENKLEEKEIVAETKCGAVKSKSSDLHEGNNDVEKHVVVCMNNSHSRGSSPSRSFRSKQFREAHTHEPIRRRRPDSYEELSERDAGPNKYVGRERTEMRMQNRSPRRRQFSGWDSRRRFSPPMYKGDEYRFGRQTVVEDRVMMSGFDQPGPGPSPGSHGYVRRHFSNGGYQGRCRRLPDGNGNRDFRGSNRSFPPGDANDYPSRMHINRMNGRRERSNSPPVFRRRLHDPQSRSKSRSRSPVSWNGRNRSPPGFRGNDNRMERVRFPFQKRFPLNQETGFMLQQRNQRNSRFFDGRNNDV